MGIQQKFKMTRFRNPSGQLVWKVSGTLQGERIRRNYKTRAGALEEKQRLELRALEGSEIRVAATVLSDLQLAEAQDAFDRLGGAYSLREAVSFFIKNYKEPTSEFKMSDVLEEFYDAKRAAGVRERSITQLRSSLGRLSKALPEKMLNEIAIEDLQNYIASKNWTLKTQNNFRADAHSFFEWCLAKPRQWVFENPAHDLPKFKIERGIPEILKFKQAQALLNHVAEKHDGTLVPYFALALFAGIRPQAPGGELGKIAKMGEGAWDLIDFQNKVIRIPPEISKTGEYRTINIQPNLAEWLKPFAKEKAPLVMPNFDKRVKAIRKEFKLGHDVLRHTYISMHVAKFKSVGATALQAGNSEAIVRRHYLKMVAENEAKRFWAIKPV